MPRKTKNGRDYLSLVDVYVNGKTQPAGDRVIGLLVGAGFHCQIIDVSEDKEAKNFIMRMRAEGLSILPVAVFANAEIREGEEFDGDVGWLNGKLKQILLEEKDKEDYRNEHGKK